MAMDFEDREHMRRHRDDVERIVAVAARFGATITPRQAYRAWREVSESSCAGWLDVDGEEDDVIWIQIRLRVAESTGTPADREAA